MDFVVITQNASWSINSLKVYKKQILSGTISGASSIRLHKQAHVLPWAIAGIALTTLGLVAAV
jgi:hypothetical protein